MPQQVSPHTSPYLEARVLNLEEEHADLRHDFNTIKELFHGLSMSVSRLEESARKPNLMAYQQPIPQITRKNATESFAEHEALAIEAPQALASLPSVTNKAKEFTMSAAKKINSIPPHLRAGAKSNGNGAVPQSPPVRTQGASQNGGRDGNGPSKQASFILANKAPASATKVDKALNSPAVKTTKDSPMTPKTIIHGEIPSFESLSLDDNNWKPHFLTTLAPLSPKISSNIPATDEIITFHADFIHNTFEGLAWSPGLRFMPGKGPCIIPNRTYYILDPKTEPFLPKAPGEHGAKLSAFFNKAPEEEFGAFEHGSSYEDVPMFVKTGSRYMYFGNYSQTRWSDKLDHDTMTARVPKHVKEYWANELTDASRDEWVTEELKKHFFPKPEYVGRFSAPLDEETSATSEEEVKLNEKMIRDVKKYVEELKDWKREADMRVSMLKKDFILEAFDRADADEPPALRLWWEYLECVGWRKDFYNLLVTLQSRNPGQSPN